MPAPAPAVVARLRALLTVAPPEQDPSSVAQTLGTAAYDPGRRGAWALGLVGVVAALVAGYFLLHGRASEQPLPPPPVVGSSAAPSSGVLVIDVEGKVRHPGLVQVHEGARVEDALQAAGGVLPGASAASLNLARKVADGEQLLVGQAAAPGGGAPAATGGALDLNLATAAELDALPGIGPVLAQRIVDWRTEHGRFASVDQLRQVSGIGESKYASLKSKVRV